MSDQAAASALGIGQAASTPSAPNAAPAPPLPSPCFVHSYLDAGLGSSARKTWQGRSDSHAHAHPSRSQSAKSGTSDGYFGGDHEGESRLGGGPARSRRRVRIPPHRSSRGAAEPSSDHSHSGSEDSASSSSTGVSLSEEEADSESDHMRSLTRQLAETAVGVREMSKQLGQARVKSTIHSVLIITKARDNHLISLTRELAIWLMQTPRKGRDTGLIVYVDSQLRNSKRFDVEGIRREHPHFFERVQRSQHASQASASTPRSAGFDAPSAASSTSSSSSQTREDGQLRFWTSDMCSRSPHLFDIVVTLGGDGTVLFCSWLFQRIVPPVVPFALGSLGFLTNFDFSNYAKVMNSALEDGIRVNLRMRFTATRATLPTGSCERKRQRAIKSGKTGEIIMRNIAEGGWDRIESPLPQGSDLRGHMTENGGDPGNNDTRPAGPPPAASRAPPQRKDKEVMCFTTRPVETFEVLNDLVVDRGPSPYVSLLEVFGNEHHMTTAQADGLCISTPTGSTAYSLSAGGSLVHPEIPSILITPICPHTLSFRPMLLPDSMELRIAVPYNSRSTAWASFDGRGRVELKQADHIKVTASRYPFPTVCAENQSTDWFNSISRTLKWNERQRQKSFVVVEEGAEKEPSSERHESKRGREDKSNQEARELETDDNEEEGEAEAEAETEAFDIDDTSTAAPTRTASPDPDPPRSAAALNRFVRRNSVRSRTSSGHHHHRHQSNGRTTKSAPTSNRASSEHLNKFGMAPLTRAKNAKASESSPSDSNSSSSAVPYPSQPTPSEQRDETLLGSPDRFGLAGPPLPPRTISERHLASADFRLDDSSPRVSAGDAGGQAPFALSASSQDSIGVQGASQQAAELQAQTRRLSGEAQAQAQAQAQGQVQPRTRDATDSRSASRKQQGAEAASASSTQPDNARSTPTQTRASSSQQQQQQQQQQPPQQRKSSSSRKRQLTQSLVDQNGRRSSGQGAALIVYGQDESDSDDLTE